MHLYVRRAGSEATLGMVLNTIMRLPQLGQPRVLAFLPAILAEPPVDFPQNDLSWNSKAGASQYNV